MFLVVAALVIESLHPLRTLEVPRDEQALGVFRYVRDAQYEYLGTPRGLHRTDRIATGTLETIAEQPVSALAGEESVLYASFGQTNEAHGSGHTLHRSQDHGATFTPIDAGLLDCSLLPWGEPCRYLVSRQIEIAPGRLFVEAGGNILVSGDDGATWTRLMGVSSDGKPAAQTCPIVFTRIGTRMLTGGECPLDFGWIGEGTLRDDLLGWVSEPERFDLPLENRNVHFIRHAGNGVVYASPEGALLKSTDGGATWRFVIHYPLEGGERYPYAYHFVVTPRLMVLGGFDKKDDVGYLAYSNNGGETWTDASHLVGNAHVELLAEDADGRLLVGLYEGDTFTLAELVVRDLPSRRRAVRP
ncbi:MAG: WD40/YVTN/BNR-like repeat-containing protein [Thermoanaerobaculia bacterium]